MAIAKQITRKRGRFRQCTWLTALAIGGLVTTAPAGYSAPADGPTVETARGPVQGFTKSGIVEFLGIPYAAAPVGDLRWRPPQQPRAWTQVLEATHFGPTCAQITELGVFAGPISVNEDCLYLNVFTTQTGTPSGGLKPVLMWIHGGGLVDGESNDYDASKLAKGGPSGPTVVVTINYRLGLFGYFAHPALDNEGHNFGNYGLMDQQAALHWIRDSIAKFGGDPTNVTVGGQSAGSTSTAANVISPLSKGLFHRAIFESGALLTVAPLSLAESRGSAFATAAGCPAGDSPGVAACLRSIGVPAVLNLQGTPSANGPYVNGLMVDGTVLPLPGDVAFGSGQFNHMPIMNGLVKDEGGFSASINEYFFGPLKEATYIAKVHAVFDGPAGPGGGPPNYPPATSDKVLAKYTASKYGSPSLAWIREMSDATACRIGHLNQLLVGQVPLYAYQFDVRTAPWYFPPLSFPHQAAHTIDIQFLFPNWHGGSEGIAHPLGPQDLVLSRELVDAWTNFMAAGNPNLTGSFPWPPYHNPADDFLAENVPSLSVLRGATFSAQHNCAFWKGILIY